MRWAVLGAAAFLGAVAPTFAQAPTIIEIRQGGQTIVNTTAPFSSVAIADPTIADALPRSDRTLILVGKQVGASDIMIFSDGNKLYHATVVVSQPVLSGKVYNHNRKQVGEYVAYQCNPVCVRTDDKFEAKGTPDIIVLGQGGATATGGSINVIIPPGAGSAPPTR